MNREDPFSESSYRRLKVKVYLFWGVIITVIAAMLGGALINDLSSIEGPGTSQVLTSSTTNQEEIVIDPITCQFDTDFVHTIVGAGKTGIPMTMWVTRTPETRQYICTVQAGKPKAYPFEQPLPEIPDALYAERPVVAWVDGAMRLGVDSIVTFDGKVFRVHTTEELKG